MKTNKWQNNFNRAVVYELYVKPIIAAAIVFIIVVLGIRWLFPETVNPVLAILAVVLYYVHFLDAKIDMLKRTLDEQARFRETKKLWIEGEIK